MMGAMRGWSFGQRESFRSDGLDHRVHDIEHRLRRAKARSDRKIAEFARASLIREKIVARADGGRPLLERFLCVLELARVRPLEAVDGLLEVTDHEQGATASFGFARSAEELVDEMVDDLPLRGVRILRLVDEHMVDLPVELVTNPVAHSRLFQQLPRPLDEIVEIGDAGSPLGMSVSS